MRERYREIPVNCARNTHATVLRLISKPRDAVVVDIPCGAGAFIARLQDCGFNCVAGVDIRNILAFQHENFRRGDMTRPLPFDDCSVDVVTCIDGIEHISNQESFIREVSRVLKTDGECIISTPNINSLRSRVRWLLTSHHHKCVAPLDETRPDPLHHIGMISFQQLRYHLHKEGLRIDAIAANRMKFAALLYAPLAIPAFAATALVYKKHGRREGTNAMCAEIFKSLFKPAVLFGETLIVRARKRS